MTLPCRHYPSDLTNAEWQLLVPLIPAAKPGGRPAIHDRENCWSSSGTFLAT